MDAAIDLPQTLLVSTEFCQVGRGVPLSDGLGLRKWVCDLLLNVLVNHFKTEEQGRLRRDKCLGKTGS